MKEGIRSSIKYLAGRRAGCDDVAPSGRKARRWPWFARITSGMPRMANGIRSTSSAICETAVRPGRRIGHAIWTRSGRSAITPPRLSPRLCRPMRTLGAPAPPPTYIQWLSCSSAFSFLSTANKGRRTLPTLTPQSDILLLARLCSTRSCCLITYIVHHPSNFFFPEGAINPFSFHFSDIQVGSFPPCVAFW
jgi:hypothetical protein